MDPDQIEYAFDSITTQIRASIKTEKKKNNLQFCLMVIFRNGRQLFFLLETSAAEENGEVNVIAHSPYKESTFNLPEKDFIDVL